MGNIINAERMNHSPIHQPTKERSHVQLQSLLALWSCSSLPPQSVTSPRTSSGLAPSLLAYGFYKYVHVYTISSVICMFHCSFWITFACIRVTCVCLWACNTETRGKASCWFLPSNSFEMGPLTTHQCICPASQPMNLQGLSLPASHSNNSWMASLCRDLHGFGSTELRSSRLLSKRVCHCATFFLHSYATLHPLPLIFSICRFNS